MESGKQSEGTCGTTRGHMESRQHSFSAKDTPPQLTLAEEGATTVWSPFRPKFPAANTGRKSYTSIDTADRPHLSQQYSRG